MALVDTSDPLWPRVVAAFVGMYGPVPEGLTADDFTVNNILTYIKGVVRNYESTVALQPAPALVIAAQTKVDADFSAQLVVAKPVDAQPVPIQPIGP